MVQCHAAALGSRPWGRHPTEHRGKAWGIRFVSYKKDWVVVKNDTYIRCQVIRSAILGKGIDKSIFRINTEIWYIKLPILIIKGICSYLTSFFMKFINLSITQPSFYPSVFPSIRLSALKSSWSGLNKREMYICRLRLRTYELTHARGVSAPAGDRRT